MNYEDIFWHHIAITLIAITPINTDMGIVRLGPPTELILQLKTVYPTSTFIETGTYMGNTAYWASQFFDQVITIEFSQPIYQSVCAKYADIKHIQFIYGDSRTVLREWVPQLQQAAVFWLDAHWSGGATYGATDECPLLEEIALINQSAWEHCILIDDARLFIAPPPMEHDSDQWPDINEVIQILNAANYKRYIAIVEDVIIAVPIALKPQIVEYCQGHNPATSFRSPSQPQQGLDPLQTSGEVTLLKDLMLTGSIMFDIGAHEGEWSLAALRQHPHLQIHAFEPVLQTYQTLLRAVAEAIQAGKIVPVNWAIADQETMQTFYMYESTTAWSTLHRRWDVEQRSDLAPPIPLSVASTTLDRYCQQQGIQQINFVKIDVEGAEYSVLLGARNLLKRSSIDYILFEYGGTWNVAKTTLEAAFKYLQTYRYGLFKLLSNGLEYRPIFSPEYEDFAYGHYLAVSDRLLPYMFGQPPQMPDLQELCQRYKITPMNVIHVGAHDGQEILQYQAMGAGALLIEANPDVFERLQNNLAGVENMVAIQCAISDRPGTVQFHITSNDQSSSILPLKQHQDIYPNIQEVDQIEVLAITLDDLLEDLQLDPGEFNVLNLDIQGAELLALKGATHLLQHLDAIYTEVNYQELYEGCALINEIDDFLDQFGFERVETVTPYHPSWGDAFYVKKPVITMSTLGRNGRFANQFFQYAFLKTYAKEHHLRVETSPWIGQFLFGHDDPAIVKPQPVVGSPDDLLPDLGTTLLPGSEPPYKNVELWGFFQYHTQFYAPHKSYIQSLFQPVPIVEAVVRQGLLRLQALGKTLVGIHLRRGDYGYGYFFIAPSEWYREWLRGLWETLDNPVLFIASDEPERVVDDFADYHPLTINDLGITLPEAPFYPDFYILSHCDIVAISNSSFSFAASMLNQQGKFFFRPHWPTQKLIPFDPWNSEPLLKDVTSS